jgi:hypothetical protein
MKKIDRGSSPSIGRMAALLALHSVPPLAQFCFAMSKNRRSALQADDQTAAMGEGLSISVRRQYEVAKRYSFMERLN